MSKRKLPSWRWPLSQSATAAASGLIIATAIAAFGVIDARQPTPPDPQLQPPYSGSAGPASTTVVAQQMDCSPQARPCGFVIDDRKAILVIPAGARSFESDGTAFTVPQLDVGCRWNETFGNTPSGRYGWQSCEPGYPAIARQVDVLTQENAYPSAGLVAQQMPPHTITMHAGRARIAVLGDIPTGGSLQVAGGASCAVVAGVVAPGATVHVEGGGATVVLSESNSQSQPGVSVDGGGARILIRAIDPRQPFKGCDEPS